MSQSVASYDPIITKIDEFSYNEEKHERVIDLEHRIFINLPLKNYIKQRISRQKMYWCIDELGAYYVVIEKSE